MAEYKYECAKVRIHDGIAWLSMNRPDKRNAMSPQLHYDMDDALARLVPLQQMHQKFDLAIVIHRDVVLLDRLDRELVLRQVHLDGLKHVALGQLPDVGADRGGEQ